MATPAPLRQSARATDAGARLRWFLYFATLGIAAVCYVFLWSKLFLAGVVTWEWFTVVGLLPGLIMVVGCVWFGVEIWRDVAGASLWWRGQLQEISLRRRVIIQGVRSRRSYDRKWHGPTPKRKSEPLIINGHYKARTSTMPAQNFEDFGVADDDDYSGAQFTVDLNYEPADDDTTILPELPPAMPETYTADMRRMVEIAFITPPSFRTVVPGYMTRARYLAARDALYDAGVLAVSGQSYILASWLATYLAMNGATAAHVEAANRVYSYIRNTTRRP
jgi:hypothetical protein